MQVSKYIIFPIVILSLVFLSNSISQTFDYVQGEVIIAPNGNLFDFPEDIYAAYISFNDGLSNIGIDSVVALEYKPKCRMIKQEKIISFEYLSEYDPELSSQLNIHFPTELNEFLKSIKAYWIGRRRKSISMSDTLLHPHKIRKNPVTGRSMTKLVKHPNFVNYITIKYKANWDALEISRELKKFSCIHDAFVNQILLPEPSITNPILLHQEIPIIPDSIKLNKNSSIVVVTVLVDTFGNAENVTIFSSKNESLNVYALNAAKKCRFKPGMINEKKVRMKMNVQYTFK